MVSMVGGDQHWPCHFGATEWNHDLAIRICHCNANLQGRAWFNELETNHGLHNKDNDSYPDANRRSDDLQLRALRELSRFWVYHNPRRPRDCGKRANIRHFFTSLYYQEPEGNALLRSSHTIGESVADSAICHRDEHILGHTTDRKSTRLNSSPGYRSYA